MIVLLELMRVVGVEGAGFRMTAANAAFEIIPARRSPNDPAMTNIAAENDKARSILRVARGGYPPFRLPSTVDGQPPREASARRVQRCRRPGPRRAPPPTAWPKASEEAALAAPSSCRATADKRPNDLLDRDLEASDDAGVAASRE
jgi:hypothetical protein